MTKIEELINKLKKKKNKMLTKAKILSYLKSQRNPVFEYEEEKLISKN